MRWENKKHQAFLVLGVNMYIITKSFLSGRDNIVISCCTYHNNEDGALIEKIYEEIDYKYEYSSGYMLFARYDTPTYPFFRHGVIRARKKS